MAPIRVLNIVSMMSPGGIENFLLNVYRNIDRNKIQFDFLTHYGEEGKYNKLIRSMGGKIYNMPKIRDLNKVYYHRFFIYRNALIQFFKEHQEYRILHGHMTNTAAIYMPIAKKYGNIKYCIAHSHSTKSKGLVQGLVTNILHKPVRNLADKYFACSESAARWIFLESDLYQGKVFIIKNGIESNKYIYSKEKSIFMKQLLNVQGKFVVGNVARFKKSKNHLFLVDVFSQILKIRPDSVLLLVGDGELKNLIMKYVSKLNITDSVIFLGLREDIADVMQAMDVFVLPSFFEGLPVVTVEAQASGLPCIIANTITKETDITGNVSFLDLQDSCETWAKKIISIYDQFTRRNEMEAIIKNGYDIKRTADFLQEFYLNLK